MEGTLDEFSRVEPGRHMLRPEVVAEHQRQRILRAAIELIGEEGYRAVSVAAIVKRARVARLKFYETFSSKQDCFLAAFDEAVAETARIVAGACEAAGDDLVHRVPAGIEALLGHLDRNPLAARACIVEAPLLGAQAGDRRERALAAFAPLLEGAREGAPEVGASPAEPVLDGLYWLLYDAILTGAPEPIADLRAALVEFALIPFVGPLAARGAAAG